jgi:hypothetical protein
VYFLSKNTLEVCTVIKDKEFLSCRNSGISNIPRRGTSWENSLFRPSAACLSALQGLCPNEAKALFKKKRSAWRVKQSSIPLPESEGLVNATAILALSHQIILLLKKNE